MPNFRNVSITSTKFLAAMFVEFCLLPFLKATAFINFGCLFRITLAVGFLELSLYDNNDGDLKESFK